MLVMVPPMPIARGVNPNSSKGLANAAGAQSKSAARSRLISISAPHARVCGAADVGGSRGERAPPWWRRRRRRIGHVFAKARWSIQEAVASRTRGGFTGIEKILEEAKELRHHLLFDQHADGGHQLLAFFGGQRFLGQRSHRVARLVGRV